MIFRNRLRHPFEERVINIKRRMKPEPFDWYRFDSFANIPQLEALLPNGLDSLLDLAAGEPVADIGAADGDLAFLLESLGCNLTAIDWPGTNANQMYGLELLRRELGSAIRIRRVDLDQQFQLDGERFGLVLSLGLLYHLKNPYYFLEKLGVHARRCLLGTRILPRGKTSEPVAWLTADREFENDPTNFWFFSESGILRLLDRCGWDTVATRIIGDGKDDRFFCLAESRAARTKPTIRLLEGWHEVEERAWRWTDREFSAVIENMPGASRLELQFRIPPELLTEPLVLRAWAGGQELTTQTFGTPGAHVYSQPMSPASARCEVRIRLSHTFSPDGRDLGVVVILPCETVIDENCGLRLTVFG